MDCDEYGARDAVCVSFSLFGSFEKYQSLNFIVQFCSFSTFSSFEKY